MELKRVLGASDAGWIVAGSMIGSGIFITPGLVAGRLPGMLWPLSTWILGGAVALAGAAVYAELGGRMPRAGGDYRYITDAYGPLWGFMNGWAAVTLTFSAAAAAQCRAALGYVAAVLPIEDTALFVTLAAPVAVFLLTGANLVGARVAGRTTVIFTAGPLLLLLGLFVAGALGGQGGLHWPEEPFARPAGFLPLAVGMALIPVFFTYSGWNAAAYLAGEMRDPGRNLARGLLAGTGLTALLYVLVNVALLLLLPPEQLANSTRPASDAAELYLGPTGGKLLALTIAAAILGSANVTLMAGARVYFAMAGDRMGPRALTRVSRAGVPSVALWVGGVWAAVLSVIADIGQLVDWATLGIMLLSSLTVTSLFVFRRRDPDGATFRCPGYPLTPVVYLVVCLGAAVSAWFYDPQHALIGLAILAAGFPVYFVSRRFFGWGSPA